MSPSAALWGGAHEDSSGVTGNAGTDGGDNKCGRCEVNKSGSGESRQYLRVACIVPKDVHPLLMPSQMVQQKTTVERSAMDNMTAVMI